MPTTAEGKVKAKAKRKSSSVSVRKEEEALAARQKQNSNSTGSAKKSQEGKPVQFYEVGVHGVYNSYVEYQNQAAAKQDRDKRPSIKTRGSKKENVENARKRNKGQLEVPLWTVDEVTRWVASMGFPARVIDLFRETKVDGDILLQLDDKHLENDLHMTNGIQRKRFLRELSILKKDADYSSVDSTGMAKFLVSEVGQEYKMYTYNFIRNDLTMSVMRRLGSTNLNDMLIEVGITSSIHRLKMIEAILDEGIGGSEEFNMSGSRSGSFLESPTGSQHGQVYVSFNRSGRGELASLINMQLILRGLSVQMADTLVNNVTPADAIRRSRHFVIVLGQGSLAGCKGDVKCKDPLHKEVKAALDSNCNIIPVFDNFQFPDAETLPEDMRTLCFFNGVQWVHDYQEACMDKIERFITGEGPPSRGGSLGRLAIASRLTPDSVKSTPANSLRELKKRNLSSESGIFFQT